MASAMHVARHLERHRLLPEMKVQKLLYYAQAWSLAWTGRALFPDEIEAWVDGPVVRSVWVERRHGGAEGVGDVNLTEDEMAVIDAVHHHYGRLSGPELSARTHAERAWLEARGDLSPEQPSRRPISQHTMRRTYTEQVIEGSLSVPSAPLLHTVADAEDVTDAGERQRKRWRNALDILAEQ